MKQDSDNKDSANETGNKDNAGPSDMQNKKRGHPFILGNPLPALGDYGATKKFMGQIKAEAVKGKDSGPQKSPRAEPAKEEAAASSLPSGGGSMFGELKQLHFPQASGGLPGTSMQVGKPDAAKELADAFAQIASDELADKGAGGTANAGTNSTGQTLQEPPGNQLFSKGLPPLGDFTKSQQLGAEGGTAAPGGLPPEPKKKYVMASVESNAKNYLKQLENEANEQDSERSSGERAPARFANFKNMAEKRDETASEPNILRKDAEKGGASDGLPIGATGPAGPGLTTATSSLFSGSLMSLAGIVSSSQPTQGNAASSQKKTTTPIILPNPSQIAGQRGGIGASQLGPGPQFKNFTSLGAQPAASPFAAGAQSTGEIIADTYHTYHSIGTQAPLVPQDENLSSHDHHLRLASRNVKVFVNPDPRSYARNLICFIENSRSAQPTTKGNSLQAAMKNLSLSSPSASVEVSNNISLLVNQNDQISNILSEFHSKGKLQGKILDFTVRHFRYLYLLYAKSIVVLDFRDLLSSRMDSSASDLQIVESIQLDRAQISKQPGSGVAHAEHQSAGSATATGLPGAKTTQSSQPPSVVQGTSQNFFSCIEVANDREQSLLLFSDVASRRAGLAFPSPSGDGNLAKPPGDDSGETVAALDGAALVSPAGRAGADKSSPNICEVLHIDCSKFRGGKAGSSQLQQSSSNQHMQGFGSQPGGGDTETHERAGQHTLTYLQLSSNSQPVGGTSAAHHAGDHAPRGRLLDTEIWDHYLALLFEKNLVIVYDLKHSSASERDGAGDGKRSTSLGKTSKAAKKKALAAKDVETPALGAIQFEKPIFKATFADATDNVSQLFFVKDFQHSDDDGRSDSAGSEGHDQEDGSSSEDSEDSATRPAAGAARDGKKQTRKRSKRETAYAERRLHGHFLLVETKGQQAGRASQESQSSQKKTFRKLHIVQIQDNLGPLYLKDRAGAGSAGGSQAIQKASQQSLSQIAQLTIKETNSKFVQYDAARGIVFMMNQEKQDRHIRLFTVKLKKEQVDDSDSDERVSKGAAGVGNISGRGQPLFRFRFEFITEVRLQISNQSFSAIQYVVQNKAKAADAPQLPVPVYLQVLHSGLQGILSQSESAGDLSTAESEQYYIYTNVMDQVLVFQRSLSDLTPSSVQMVRVLSGVKAPSGKELSANALLPAGTKGDRRGRDASKLGQVPESFQDDVLRRPREAVEGSASAITKPTGPALAGKVPDADDEGETEEVEARAAVGQANDSAEEGNASNEDGEKIVSTVLGGEEELTAEEAAAMRAYKQIELECDEEARRDAQQLQKNIDEAMKEIMSDEEEVRERRRRQMEQDMFGMGLMDLGFGDVRDPSPVAQGKLDANDEDVAAAEPDAENDQDDGDEKVLPSQQNLSKKERKAQKKLEKKSKQPKKDALLPSHEDQASSIVNKAEQAPGAPRPAQAQSSPKAGADREKQGPAHTAATGSQVPPALAGNAAASHSQAGKKKLQKLQEQQVVENLGELTRKYQELAQKTNQLQQLLSRQQQQKQEVDATIRKAVKDGVGERIIGQHVRDIVVPLLTKKIKTMDDQVAEVIMPRVEAQIETLFRRVVEKEGSLKQSGASTMPKPQEVSQLVQREFRQALQGQILPSLEASLKQMLQNLEKKLQQVDVALCEKLAEEEERWKAMQTQYQNSLSWLKLFHKKVGQMAQEMIRQQMREQAQHQQTVIYQQMEAEILSKMQAQIQQTVQLQVQSKVQEYLQFQVPQQVQMQLQAQLQQYGQPFAPQTPPSMGLYPMNMAGPSLERQVSQTSAASQSIPGSGIFALQKQSSTAQVLPQSQVPNQALGAPFFEQVGAATGHTPHAPGTNEQTTTPLKGSVANVSEDFLAQYRLMKKEVRGSSSKKNDQLARERKLREQIKEIDAETEGFKQQMQLLKKQQSSVMMTSSGQQMLMYNDSGEDEEDREILASFEQKQEARKQKLIEQSAKSARSTSGLGGGGPPTQAAGAPAAGRNDRDGSPDDPLAAFLITKSTVQPRPLQSTNLTGTGPKPVADAGARTAAKANNEPQAANAADIFQELDAEGADFLGQELGYRGMEDSEHEDSEQADDQPEQQQDEGRDEDGEEGEADPSAAGTAYLTDVRTMRPYDDDEGEAQEQPSLRSRPPGSSYAPADGRPYDSQPQWAASRSQQQPDAAKPAGNRGAMKLLSSATATRLGVPKDQKRGQRQRNNSRGDDAFETSSGYQSREYQKRKFDKTNTREDTFQEDGARRRAGQPGKDFGGAGGERQLTSWKDTMADATGPKGGSKEADTAGSQVGKQKPLSKWEQ